MATILITGGAGYVGSHICLKLQEAGFEPVVFDDFSNGHFDAVEDFHVVEGDVRDTEALVEVMKAHKVKAVIHMAGLIEAGISMEHPAAFYDVNCCGSFRLLEAMRKTEINHIIFSSTAALYGKGEKGQELLHEKLPVAPINPYGHSKAIVETMLSDYASIYGFKAMALRYFNAAGADPAGRVGERHDPESHLIPIALQTALGIRSKMALFGIDYDTPDGTCVRDYIHVSDLANAHVKALNFILSHEEPLFEAINIGTGKGYSVSQVLTTCRKVTGVDFLIEAKDRRPGDPAYLVADAAMARDLLDWTPEFNKIEEMVLHAWNFLKEQQTK